MTTNEELHATITARAELDRAFARQLVEEASSVMAKNLNFLLDQQQQRAEEQDTRIAAIVKEAISAQLGPLMAEFRRLEARVDLKREMIEALGKRNDARFDAIEARLERLEGGERAAGR